MEYRAVLLEKHPNFDFLQMPTVRELAGQALEAALAEAQQQRDSSKKKALVESWDSFALDA